MRVVSLKMNSNVYPLKNTNSHYLLLNTTIIPLHSCKISLIFLVRDPMISITIFALEKEISKIVVLRKHAETLCSILKKETLAQVFPCEIFEISKHCLL